MPNRTNRRNLRSEGPGTAPDPSDVDFSEAYGGQGHDREGRQKSTADEISDDLSRVLGGLEDVKKAVQGDDAAAERVAKGEYEGDAGDDEDDDGGNAGRQGGLYEGIADHLIDDEPARVRKSDSWVGDVDLDEPTSGDPTDRNARLVDPDE
jgi:hypothetical protein